MRRTSPTVRIAWWIRPPPKPRLGDDERSAARPQHVIGRDADVLVTDVALPATATERLVAEPDIAQHVDARCVAGHDEHRIPLVRAARPGRSSPSR